MHINRTVDSDVWVLDKNDLTPFISNRMPTRAEALSNLNALAKTFSTIQYITLEFVFFINERRAVFRRLPLNESFWDSKKPEVLSAETVINVLKNIEDISKLSICSLCGMKFDPQKDDKEIRKILGQVKEIENTFKERFEKEKFVSKNELTLDFRKKLVVPIMSFQSNISKLFDNFYTYTREKFNEVPDLPSAIWIEILHHNNCTPKEFSKLLFISKKMTDNIYPYLITLINTDKMSPEIKRFNLANYLSKFENIHTLNIDRLGLTLNKTIKCIKACSNLLKLGVWQIPFDEESNTFFDIKTLKNLKALIIDNIPKGKRPSLSHETLENIMIKNAYGNIDLTDLNLPGNLKSLWINELQPTGIPVITSLTSLQNLCIINKRSYASYKSGFDFGDLSKLSRLKNLIIAIDNVKIPNLTELNNLEKIIISTNSQVDQIDISSIFNIPSITFLGLQNPHITDLKGFEKLTNLRSLFLNT